MPPVVRTILLTPHKVPCWPEACVLPRSAFTGRSKCLPKRVKTLTESVRRFFFFSSRRRHTRCSRDWSSDVCSSDLAEDTLESAVERAQALSHHPPPRTNRPRQSRRSRLAGVPPHDAVSSDGAARHREIGRASCRERV